MRNWVFLLSAWAAQSNAGALGAERIRSIAETGVPLAAEGRDYLEHSLSEISTLRFFTRHATGLQWLSWIASQRAFHRLFTVLSEYSEADGILAYWFAAKLCHHIPRRLARSDPSEEYESLLGDLALDSERAVSEKARR